MAITSVESMPNRGTKQSRKSSTLRLPTAMPLGTPVEPEVKLTYSTSVSQALA